MPGIVSYGTYIPLFRLDRKTLAHEWGKPLGPGEKAVANFDEDSITMARAAAADCIYGKDTSDIDGVYFCSTTSPYKEKQAAVVVAAACDLKRDIATIDFGNSIRSATHGLRAGVDAVNGGSAKQVVVTAADCRLGKPCSEFEALFGDAAAALLIGDENIIAEIEGIYSQYHEITDVWRPDSSPYVEGWEDRFVFEQGYIPSITDTVEKALKKFGTAQGDYSKVILNAWDGRRHVQGARRLGIEVETQLQNGYYEEVGVTGCAHSFLMLSGALDEAKAGDRLLLVNYGDGTDVVSLKVTKLIEQMRGRLGVNDYIASKQMVKSYSTYAQWKGLISGDSGVRRPVRETPSSSAQWREREKILRLRGGKCKNCGTVQFPPQRVCARCQSQDNFTSDCLADKGATLFSYSLDYVADSVDSPHIVCVINFNGGGRMLCSMTDGLSEAISVGMPVQMTFRKLNTISGIHNYFWKCMPERA